MYWKNTLTSAIFLLFLVQLIMQLFVLFSCINKLDYIHFLSSQNVLCLFLHLLFFCFLFKPKLANEIGLYFFKKTATTRWLNLLLTHIYWKVSRNVYIFGDRSAYVSVRVRRVYMEVFLFLQKSYWHYFKLTSLAILCSCHFSFEHSASRENARPQHAPGSWVGRKEVLSGAINWVQRTLD